MATTWKDINKPPKRLSARGEKVRVLRSKRKEPDEDESLSEEHPNKVRRSRRLSATQTDPSNKQELCKICRNIDFGPIFEYHKSIPPLNGLPILELGDLSWAIKTRCPLCHLFFAMRFPRSSSKAEKSGYHLLVGVLRGSLGVARCYQTTLTMGGSNDGCMTIKTPTGTTRVGEGAGKCKFRSNV